MAGRKASSSAAVPASRRFSTSNSATIARCDAASGFRCSFRLIEIVLIDLMNLVSLSHTYADAVTQHQIDQGLSVHQHHFGGGAAQNEVPSTFGERAGGNENTFGDT